MDIIINIFHYIICVCECLIIAFLYIYYYCTLKYICKINNNIILKLNSFLFLNKMLCIAIIYTPTHSNNDKNEKRKKKDNFILCRKDVNKFK